VPAAEVKQYVYPSIGKLGVVEWFGTWRTLNHHVYFGKICGRLWVNLPTFWDFNQR